ncbi:MAG: hypothetical protein ABI461_16820 [Polyangiaceae bacterium]
MNDYLANVELPLGALVVVARGHEPDKLPYVDCIVCARRMDRVNFASRSDAIVDICNIHGIWLDAGELIPILHFVKMRTELGEVPITDAEREAQAKLFTDAGDSATREALIRREAEPYLVPRSHGGYTPEWLLSLFR